MKIVRLTDYMRDKMDPNKNFNELVNIAVVDFYRMSGGRSSLLDVTFESKHETRKLKSVHYVVGHEVVVSRDEFPIDGQGFSGKIFQHRLLVNLDYPSDMRINIEVVSDDEDSAI